MNEWPVVRLEEVARIERVTVQADDIKDDDYLVGLENIRSGGGFVDVSTAGDVGVNSTKFRFGYGHLLFGKLRPYLAKIECPEFEGVCSTDIIPIVPGQGLEKQYLRYVLLSPPMVKIAATRASGANLPRLSPKELGKFEFPLPSLEDQSKIVHLMGQIDTLRANRREAIALLDELAQSIFLDMFGDPVDWSQWWPLRKIGDIAESVTYGTSAKAGHSGDLPVLRMGNITASGGIDLTNLKYLGDGEVHDKHLVQDGDVLFNRTNSAELVGKTAMYRGAKRLAYAGYLVRVRVNDRNCPEYLAAFLNTAYMKRVFRNMCKKIVGMANINAKELRAIDIAEPPLEIQKDFAKRISVIEELKARHRRHVAELDALFASLQDRAFRGELWTEESAPVP